MGATNTIPVSVSMDEDTSASGTILSHCTPKFVFESFPKDCGLKWDTLHLWRERERERGGGEREREREGESVKVF